MTEHHLSCQNLVPLSSLISFGIPEKNMSLTVDNLFQKVEEDDLLMHLSDHHPMIG